jgi:hypothetical protein
VSAVPPAISVPPAFPFPAPSKIPSFAPPLPPPES